MGEKTPVPYKNLLQDFHLFNCFQPERYMNHTTFKNSKQLKYSRKPQRTEQFADELLLLTAKLLPFVENKAPALWQRLIFHLYEKNCAV
jgi:hypothetical protein